MNKKKKKFESKNFFLILVTNFQMSINVQTSPQAQLTASRFYAYNLSMDKQINIKHTLGENWNFLMQR